MAGITETRNQDATVYVGDLDQQVTEALLWELCLQAGPVVNVHIPRDKLSGAHTGFGFVEFHTEDDADYGIKILNMIKLYGKAIRVNKASRDKKTLDVGANIFVGNLDPDVDEKLLYDTFSAFGVIISTPKIMREEGATKGYGFISFDSFEASDLAIETMNGQYLCNRPISVSYATKKDTKGERHGTPAERLLAANNPNIVRARSNNQFSAPPSMAPSFGMPPPQMAGLPLGMSPTGFVPRSPFAPVAFPPFPPGQPMPGFPGGYAQPPGQPSFY